VGEFAEAFALDSGRKTIEMTPGGRILDHVTNFSIGRYTINNSLPGLSDRLWGFGSRHYAEQASGEVISITKGQLRSSAIFHVEREIIECNPAAYIRRLRIPRSTTR
jgi:hypothetical protein